MPAARPFRNAAEAAREIGIAVLGFALFVALPLALSSPPAAAMVKAAAGL